MEYFFSFEKLGFPLPQTKSSSEGNKKECKDGEPVKDANIIHKVVKPAPAKT
jgi:hypothetical protein